MHPLAFHLNPLGQIKTTSPSKPPSKGSSFKLPVFDFQIRHAVHTSFPSELPARDANTKEVQRFLYKLLTFAIPSVEDSLSGTTTHPHSKFCLATEEPAYVRQIVRSWNSSGALLRSFTQDSWSEITLYKKRGVEVERELRHEALRIILNHIHWLKAAEMKAGMMPNFDLYEVDDPDAYAQVLGEEATVAEVSQEVCS